MSARNGLPPGIMRRHARSCPAVRSDDLEVCGCRPRFQAQAGPRRARRTRTFSTVREARQWRAQVELETGAGARGEALTVRASGERWLRMAETGEALTRSGTRYKPSTLAGYRLHLRLFVFPALGTRRLDSVTRGDLLALIGRLQTEGMAPTSIGNTVVPIRAIYRWAADHEFTTRNPTRSLAIAGVSQSRRERFAAPDEIRALLDALPERDQAVWATAAYAGLRRGELMALRWQDIDLAAGDIRVRRSYDPVARQTGVTKTIAGDRTVPISRVLRPYLLAHRGRAVTTDGLVFPRGSLAGQHRGDPANPFAASSLLKRARDAWRAAGLAPVGLHDCRHSFGSALLAAGVAMKTVSRLMGHTSIRVTIDIYGHLLPDDRRNAIERLDGLLTATPTHQGRSVAGSK